MNTFQHLSSGVFYADINGGVKQMISQKGGKMDVKEDLCCLGCREIMQPWLAGGKTGVVEMPHSFTMRDDTTVFAVMTCSPTCKKAFRSAMGLKFVCGACGVEGTKMMQCGKCKAARYCSKECQRSHWKEHKNSCDIKNRVVDL